jgi:formate dehydrogenase subunit delta
MDPMKLVAMANQIGAFFASEPDRAVAAEGIYGHLRRFWEPRMRRALYAWLDDHGGAGLDPRVLEVVRARRADLAPKEPAA